MIGNPAVGLLFFALVVGGSHRHRERLRLRGKRLPKLFTAGFLSPEKDGFSRISIAGFVSLGRMFVVVSGHPSFTWIAAAGVGVDLISRLFLMLLVLVWLGDIPFRVGTAQDICFLGQLH
ncbi:hypothetical protein Rs2_52684 [Raphanus sativus]|nr:hypothetical protein Rs2_52684 [Raphanus sativus]